MNWHKQLFFRRRRYDELSESIREHLDEKIADMMDRGMRQDEAESRARREFGSVTLIEERSRDNRGAARLRFHTTFCSLA
jgi:hypothetical protein